jgi:hypothetical protein
MLLPKAIVLRIPKPKHIAPKAKNVIAVTLKKSAGLCISCLNLKIWVFTSNIPTESDTKLAKFMTL